MKIYRLTPTHLFVLTLAGGIVLNIIFPVSLSSVFLSREIISIVGIGILLVALILNLMAYNAFKKHHTPYAPFSKPKLLIQDGIFRYSRNPVYLALMLSHLGLGMIVDMFWIIIGTVILWQMLDRYIIPEEEAQLHSYFKAQFTSYTQHTRRWF
ncbi:MAG: isoprenylcysteine carboxylmethyltransferase family protein [Campylobacterales bacterium]|nr:isoprenylcysteine carboxylmethyltransferase family protein [Campylobacterales bacterium]